MAAANAAIASGSTASTFCIQKDQLRVTCSSTVPLSCGQRVRRTGFGRYLILGQPHGAFTEALERSRPLIAYAHGRLALARGGGGGEGIHMPRASPRKVEFCVCVALERSDTQIRGGSARAPPARRPTQRARLAFAFVVCHPNSTVKILPSRSYRSHTHTNARGVSLCGRSPH